MHIMIATDGHVSPEKGAQAASKLGEGGKVTVLTVIEVPRKLLSDMREAATGQGHSDAAAQLLVDSYNPSPDGTPRKPTGWVGDDAAIAQYVKSRTLDATGALVEALNAAGVDHEVVAKESEEVAQTIIDEAQESGVDILIIGTRGLGRFEGLLGSISTKVARRASCSVLLVR